MNINTSPPLVDPRHSSDSAARYLGLAPVTLRMKRSCKTIAIPYFKVGTKIVYFESDLDAYLESVKVEVE